MKIVKIDPEMSGDFLKLLLELDNETKYMMFEPGERTITSEQLKARLSGDDSDGIYFGIEMDNGLVGFISTARGAYKRIRHSAYIVVGILERYTGKGMGKLLFEEVEKWAVSHGLTRLELTVMSHNKRAIRLYEKMGFATEGTKLKAMVIDGRYVDEYYMAKLL